MKKPNIVLITVDSLRSDCLKYMPNLMKIAEKSIFTDKCVVGGMPTMYSFPSILDGVYPFDKYASLFPKRGFLIEKLSQMTNYRLWYSNGGNIYAYIRNTNTLQKDEDKRFIKLKKFIEKMLPKECFLKLYMLKHYYLNRDLCKSSLEKDISSLWNFLNTLEKNENFIAWLHVMDVHLPYYPDQEQCDRNYLKFRYFIYSFDVNRVLKFIQQSIRFPLENKFEVYDLYDSRILNIALTGYKYYLYACRKIDDILYKLIINIKKNFPNTFFVITSDHGEMFGEYGSYIVFHHPIAHNDTLNRVPLIIFGDGINPSDISDRLIGSIDILPTVVDILGIKFENKFQGMSLLKKTPDKRFVYSYSVFLNYPVGDTVLRYYAKPAGKNSKILLTAFIDNKTAFTMLEDYDKPVPYSYPYPPDDIKKIMLDEIAKIRRRTKMALEALELRKRMSKRDNR